MPTTPAPLHDTLDVARPIVEAVVWCTVATVGPDGAPRTRCAILRLAAHRIAATRAGETGVRWESTDRS